MAYTVRVDGQDWTLPDYAVQIDERLSACRSCGESIVWGRTSTGKRAPIERDGTNHFARCPQAATWRRKTP